MPDPVDAFLGASLPQRLRMVRDPGAAGPLRAWLGAERFAGYHNCGAGAAHLGGGPTNLVFLPGVMGSMLASAGYGGIWWLSARALGRLDGLRLAPDGRSDADAAARIRPVAVHLSYARFLGALLAEPALAQEALPYDWRKPLPASAARLAGAIGRARAANGGMPVHLVAHSMGGLLIRVTLMRHPRLWRHIGKIVFIGTPQFGSPVIASYLKHHLWGLDRLVLLGGFLSRRTLRSMWGVLSLLPAPVGVYPGTRGGGGTRPHPCANFDLHSAAAYRLGLDAIETGQLQAALTAAAALHRELAGWHRELDFDKLDRMAAIVGVGYRTLFRFGHHDTSHDTSYHDTSHDGSTQDGSPHHDTSHDGFRHHDTSHHGADLAGSGRGGPGPHWRRTYRETARVPGDPHREGDGRVPVAAAVLDGVRTWYVRCRHGDLAGDRRVTAAVVDLLAGRDPDLPRSPEQALAAHLASHPDGAAPGDDPGYLDERLVPGGPATDLSTGTGADLAALPLF